MRDRVREAEKTSYVNKIKRRCMKSSQQGRGNDLKSYTITISLSMV